MPDTTTKREPTFDGYAQATPAEPWEYVLDDYGFTWRPGWWPFTRGDDTTERKRRDDTLTRWARRDGRPNPAPTNPDCGVASVRLSPDVAVRAWRNEYVLVYPDDQDPGRAVADLTLWVRPQGMGGYVHRVSVDLDFASGTAQPRSDVPTELADQLDGKLAKLVRFFDRSREARDAGAERPMTASDQADEEAGADA